MAYKIVYPYMGSDYGGSYRSGILLAKDLPDVFEPTVIFPKEGKASEIAQDYGVNYSIIDLGDGDLTSLKEAGKKDIVRQIREGFSQLPNVNHLREYLNENDVDLVHTNDSRTTLIWGLAASLSQKPCVWHVRRENSSKIWDSLRLLLSDHAICVSESTADSFGPFPQLTPHSVVYNGLDFERFNNNNDSLGDIINSKDDEKVIAYIGYLVDRKRPLLFAKSAVNVLTNDCSTHAVMIGSDEDNYYDKITELVGDCGVGDNFHMLGFREDVGKLLDDIDLLVMTSKIDGEAFPRVVIEAMASQTPVIATNSAGVSEAIVDNKTGCVLPHDISPQELSHEITKLLNNEERLEMYARNSASRAKKHFSSRNVSDQVSDIYLNILE